MIDRPAPRYEFIEGRDVCFPLGNLSARVVTSASFNGEMVESFDLINEVGESRSILAFLPDGWKIKLCANVPRQSEDQGYADPMSDLILLPRERVTRGRPAFYFEDNLESFLALLHEAGHANFPSDPNFPKKYADKLAYLSHLQQDRGRYQAYHRFLEQNTIPNERRAWMYAIRVLRILRDEGFALGSREVVNEAIRQHVDTCLRSYGDPRKVRKS